MKVLTSDGTILCNEILPGQVCAAPAQLPFGMFSAWRSLRTGPSLYA